MESVRLQIKAAIFRMIPSDSEVTSEEVKRLHQREIFRQLNGVFWNVIDNDPVMAARKEHFYDNGIRYSSAVDVWNIFPVASVAYSVASIVQEDWFFVWCSLFYLIGALICRYEFFPILKKSTWRFL